MWPDNETEQDYLNFTGVADTVAEIIYQASGRPISIGVSGSWGVGKSSMIRLIRRALASRVEIGNRGEDGTEFLFVDFNAWLYQGYDDARAALMEAIATELEQEAEKRKKGLDKAKEFLRRVNWLRAAKLTVGSAVALAAGLPPVGFWGDILRLGKKVRAGEVDEGTIGEMGRAAEEAGDAAAGLWLPKEGSSPPKEIQALRDCFEQALHEMDVTLVVLIDDLDRCLPETTISTLEAIRLFLFLENTAFVIAADDAMIKHAVKRHFAGIDDELVTNYFDKLIQVPIRVPPLGTQEVRAYMMLLFVENSGLPAEVRDRIRARACEQLSLTWQGKRVDSAFMRTLYNDIPAELIGKFDSADRLAPLMTTSTGIVGNPRLIKRFLNALAIRMAISRAHNVGVDEAALVKMMLFERCGDSKAYSALTKAVSEDRDGKAHFLAEWEDKALSGEALSLEPPWDTDPNFVLEWLKVPPRLADMDLRGVLYVSREHAPLITPEDRLSSDAAQLLVALVEHPDMAEDLRANLTKISRPELSIVMDRLLGHARQEQEWGTPAILEACLVVAHVDPPQGQRLAAFLMDRPHGQIRPGIVPKIADQPWSKSVFDNWETGGVSQPVKRAIKQRRDHGNVAVQ